MPRGDATGPDGNGPQTGRGLGNCKPTQGQQQGQSFPYNGPYGRGFGRGKGFGRGFGRGQGFGRNQQQGKP